MEQLQSIEQQIAAGVMACEARLPKAFTEQWDKWLASSALQKSIRRGYADTALLMARGFVDHDPDYLWRRINVMAMEDIGIANVPLVNQVLYISGKRRLIKKMGEASVAAYLVHAMCQSVKDRNSCELPLALDRHADFAEIRESYSLKNSPQLLALIQSPNLYERTLAIWTLMGTKKYPADHFYSEGIELDEVLEHFGDDAATTVRLAKSKGTFAMSVGLLSLSQIPASQLQLAEEHPTNPEYHGIYPICAIDKHTRIGKKATHQWILNTPPLKQFLREHVPYEEWMRHVNLVLFAVETENVNLRLRYEHWQDPLWRSTEGAVVNEQFTRAHLIELFRLVRQHLPELNEHRISAFKKR